MDRSILKERAKQSYQQKTGASIAVAFILSALNLLTSQNFTFKFNDFEFNSASSFFNMFDTASEIFSPIIAVVSFFGIIISIAITPIFTVGANRYFLKLRKNEPTDVGEIVGNFRERNGKKYENIIIISLLEKIFISLWTCLFIIPGIIKALEYFGIDYILAIRPDIDRKSAFKMSRNLMNGHKGELFALGLSFIGWGFLSLMTAGILGIVFVAPYYQATMAEFFSEVRLDGLRRGVITVYDLPDYGAPEAGFNSQYGYGQNPYGNPQNPYGNPQNPYGNPQNSYGNPQNPYGNPQNPYGNP